ncbi:MAG: hypothetical protein JXB26_03175 [Candidatus Aminicenantes bacterium]|nr:hypothetical protein [Candidatus Aminicenantes bacterium]
MYRRYEEKLHQYVKENQASLLLGTNEQTEDGINYYNTADGLYGRSAAPYQHFSIAIIRAVENRRFLLRAATTGICGIIDPYGRILDKTELMTETLRNETIHPRSDLTLYVRLGDILPYTSLTLTLVFLILALIRKKNEKP